ncbi:hypothetical protein CSPX01_04967 [Colletotrichum filicis]|nr:hypothetical protein CSPX01_04967 [Colletotrichum filicis]
MKFATIVAAITLVTSGVLATPSERNNLMRRDCYDCHYKSFDAGRCDGSCSSSEPEGSGQVCRKCISGCPATTDADRGDTPAEHKAEEIRRIV